jgi:hypothetical protein
MSLEVAAVSSLVPASGTAATDPGRVLHPLPGFRFRWPSVAGVRSVQFGGRLELSLVGRDSTRRCLHFEACEMPRH